MTSSSIWFYSIHIVASCWLNTCSFILKAIIYTLILPSVQLIINKNGNTLRGGNSVKIVFALFQKEVYSKRYENFSPLGAIKSYFLEYTHFRRAQCSGKQTGSDKSCLSFQKQDRRSRKCIQSPQTLVSKQQFTDLPYVFRQIGLSKQCRPRWDAAVHNISSGSTLFATYPAIFRHNTG